MNYLEIFIKLNSIVGVITMIYYFPQFLFMILGFFYKNPYKQTENYHKYAIAICAKDEESVIGLLVESLYKMDYPRDKFDVFVVADNCTDKTFQVAESAGAICCRHDDPNTHSKSEALDYLLQNLLNNYNDRGYEGIVVFDADNIPDINYLKEMNNSFDAGEKIVTGYRNSKNFDDNWVASGSAMFFLRECSYVHPARRLLKSSTNVSGTGFLVDWNIIKERGGWPYRALTEDIEFTMNMIADGYQVAFNSNAIYYDEQPVKYLQSYNQRERWCRGGFASHIKNFKKLTKKLFTKNGWSAYDLLVMTSPMAIVFFMWSFIYMAVSIVSLIVSLCVPGLIPQNLLIKSLIDALNFWIFMWALGFIAGLLTMLKEHKRIYISTWKKCWVVFTYPIFITSFIFISLTAAFKKEIEWRKIDHTRSIDLEEIKKNTKK